MTRRLAAGGILKASISALSRPISPSFTTGGGVVAEMIEAFQRKGQNFRIGRRCVRPADGFETRLHELAAFARAAS